MAKNFYSKFRIISKELIGLTLQKIDERPENINVGMHIAIKADEQNANCKGGDTYTALITLGVKMYDDEKVSAEATSFKDVAPDTETFRCTAAIEITLMFQEPCVEDEPLGTRYAQELLSLAYDDFRIIIEDAINRTSYKGFYLPDDFREIATNENLLT